MRDLTKKLDMVSAEASRERYYVHFYADQSDIVHSGPTAFKKYVRVVTGRVVITSGPSTAATGDLTDAVPSFATWFLCEMSAIVDVAFGLGIGAEVNTLKAKVGS